MILIELFTSPTCPHCPRAKEMAENIVHHLPEVLMIERDISDPENAGILAEYGIQSVPAMVINRKEKIIGVPRSEHELMMLINRV